MLPVDEAFKVAGKGTTLPASAAFEPAPVMAADEALKPAPSYSTAMGLDLSKPVESPFIKDPAETFFGGVGSMVEGGKRALWQMRLEGIRQQKELAKSFPNDPKVQERSKELENLEQEALADLNSAKDLQDTYAAYDEVLARNDKGIVDEAQRAMVRSSPALVGALATFLATKSPGAATAVAAGGGGEQVFADSFKEAADKGLPTKDALAYATDQMLLESAGEMVGMKAILKPAQKFLGKFVTAVGVNAGEEVATETAQAINEWIKVNPNLTLGEITHRMAVAGLAGGATAAVATPVFEGAQRGQDYLAEQLAERQMFKDLEGSANSRLKSPEQLAVEGMMPEQGATFGRAPLAPQTEMPAPVLNPSVVPVAPESPPQDLNSDANFYVSQTLVQPNQPAGSYSPQRPAPIYTWETDHTAGLANLTMNSPQEAATWVLNNYQKFNGFSLRQLFQSPQFVQVPEANRTALLDAVTAEFKKQGAPLVAELKETNARIEALESAMASAPAAKTIPLSPQEQQELQLLQPFTTTENPAEQYRNFYKQMEERGWGMPPGLLTSVFNNDKIPAPNNSTAAERGWFATRAKKRLSVLTERTKSGSFIPDEFRSGPNTLGGRQPFSAPTPSITPTPFVTLDHPMDEGGKFAEIPVTFDYRTPKGQVAVGRSHGLSEKVEPLQQKLAKIIKTWQKQLALEDFTVLVDLRLKTGSLGGAVHTFGADEKGASIELYVKDKTPTAEEAREIASVLAHEIGHAFGKWKFVNSKPEVQAAIQEDYKRQLRMAMGRMWEEAKVLLGGNVETFADGRFDGRTVDQIVMGQLNFDPEATAYNKHMVPGYLFSFEEYLAHQMEKALRDNYAGMQAPVKVFFRELFVALKKLYTAAKKAAEDLAGGSAAWTETYRQWLDLHIDQSKARGLQERVDALHEVLLGLTEGKFPKDLVPKVELSSHDDISTAVGGIPPKPPSFSPQMVQSVPPEALKNADKFGIVKEWFGTLLALARDNPHIKELSDPLGSYSDGRVKHGYLQYTEMFANERMRWIAAADERLREFRQLSREQQDILGGVLVDQTIRGQFFTAEELQQRGVDEEGGRVLLGMREDFAAYLEAFKQSALDRIRRTSANHPNLAQLLQAKEEEFNKLLSVPYFPLSRFGHFLVIVKDGEGKTVSVESYETQLEARRAAGKAKLGAPVGYTVKLDKVREQAQAFIGMPPALVSALQGELNLTQEQQADLNDLLKKWAPEESFTKHLIRRKKTAGFSRDIQRAYASYFFAGAGHIARAKFRDDLADAVSRLHASASAMSVDSITRREIANYAQRHLDEMLTPAEDWAKLRGMVAVALLGGVLRSAFVNFTQVPAFAYPHLAARFGDVAAVKELLRAIKDSPKAFKASRHLKSWEEEALTKFSQGQALTPREEKFVSQWTGLTIEEHMALERAGQEGLTNQSLAMEIAALSHGNLVSRLKGGTQVGYYLRNLSWGLMVPFELVEKLNRRAVFLAAFRLGMDSNETPESAYQIAKTAVQQTQFEHSKWNRPQIVRGRKGAAMIFMQYQFNALSFLFGGDKGWARAWLVLFLMGGVAGLPFAENIMDLLSWLLSSKNKKVDVERELKAASKELFGDVMGNLLTLGTSRYGFGLFPMADLSGSVSMGRPVPATDLLTKSGSVEGNMSRGIADLGGAATSLGLRMYRGMMDETLPAWKRAELAMPLSVGQQAMQALRWYSTGAEKTASGATVLKFDPNDWWQAAEIAARGLGGFTPRSLNEGAPGRGEGREDYYARNEMAQFYSERRKLLMAQFAQTVMAKDRADQKEVLKEIKEYNREVPVKSMRISADQLRQSVKGRVKGAEMETRGGTSRGEREIDRGIQRGQF